MSRRLAALACLLALLQLAALVEWRNTAVPPGNPSGRHREPRRESSVPSKDEEQLAYEWFDTLGFPDLAPCPFVKVATGDTMQMGDGPPQNTYFHGFLVSDKAGEFRVFGLDLEVHSFRPTPPGTPPAKAVGYEPADLASEVGKYLDWLQQPLEFLAQAARAFATSEGEFANPFILARACAAKGQTKLAHRLWLYVNKKYKEEAEHPDEPLRQHISDEIAHALLWRAVVAFGDPSVSRRDLLAAMENIVQHYPSHEAPATTEDERLGWKLGYQAEAARHYAAILRRMVAEDDEHARRPPRQGKPPSTQERVTELIFRLRDQNGHQWSQPGECDVFAADKDSPAHQLVAIGYDAVPQLIAALEDDRLTRCVGFSRDFCFSHHVLRVGDCAEAVLERIATQHFWEAKSTCAGMIKDGEVAQTKKKVESWWAQQQRKGEKQMLIEAVERGDWQSIEPARRLVQKYPADALTAIARGARDASDSTRRHHLIQTCVPLRGTAVRTFLREELKGPFLHGRVAAAQALLVHGSDEGIQPLIEDWQRHQADETNADRVDELIKFLATCGSDKAVQALGKDLRKRPLLQRTQVIEAFAPSEWEFFWAGWGWKKPAETPTLQEAIDELLVQEFDDRERDLGRSGTFYGRHHQDPRLCDLAGLLLSLRWKVEDTYRLDGPEETCDRELAQLRNLWRQKRGLPALPLPGDAPMLGGKPGVIAQARWAADSAKPFGDWQRHLDTLKDQPLRSKTLIDLVLFAVRPGPDQVKGIQIVAERERGVSCFRLTIRLLDEKPRRAKVAAGDAARQWSFSESISVDGKGGWHTSGGAIQEAVSSEEHWRFFAQLVDATLKTPTEKSVSILLSIREH